MTFETLMTIVDDNCWWQFLMTIFDDNFWWQFLKTIFDDNFRWQFLMTILTIFSYWKSTFASLDVYSAQAFMMSSHQLHQVTYPIGLEIRNVELDKQQWVSQLWMLPSQPSRRQWPVVIIINCSHVTLNLASQAGNLTWSIPSAHSLNYKLIS